MKKVTISVELTEEEASQWAQFYKRSHFAMYRKLAISEDEAYEMLHAGQAIADALADTGYAPAMTRATCFRLATWWGLP